MVTERGRARRLEVWLAGTASAATRGLLRPLHRRLGQAVCLAVNRHPMTPQQIATAVSADAAYVADEIEELVTADLIMPLGRGKYQAAFIALDSEQWDELVTLARAPVAAVTRFLARAQRVLRQAFEMSHLAASGWTWEDLSWLVNAVLVANISITRNAPDTWRPCATAYLGDGSCLVGAYEASSRTGPFWMTGFTQHCALDLVNLGALWGCGAIARDRLQLPSCTGAMVAALADGALTGEQALTRMSGPREDDGYRLACLVAAGLAELRDGTVRLTVPVFTAADDDAFTPCIDRVVRQLIETALMPALAGVGPLLERMGYGGWRSQHPQWHRWIACVTMGEALRRLVESRVLPARSRRAGILDDMVGWTGRLRLFSPDGAS